MTTLQEPLPQMSQISTDDMHPVKSLCPSVSKQNQCNPFNPRSYVI
jgi:hypothetical protein